MNGHLDDPEMYDQETYGQDDLDEVSERGSFSPPKSYAPMAPSDHDYPNQTLQGSLLRGKGRINAETAEKFKDLKLEEIIRLLEHHQNDIRANAAGYLQHLSYENIEKKNEIRNAGGIPKLIEVLEERTDDARIIENTTGALRNISYGVDQNKVTINVAEGVQALTKTLRIATTKLQNPNSAQHNNWSLVQLHSAGALWNLSSHKNLKQPMLDQCLNTIIAYILQPWTVYMQQKSGSNPPSKYQETFTACTGIIRNLSSYSPEQNPDRARDQLRHTDGLLDSLVDIVNIHYPKDVVESKYFENIICGLRNLSYKCNREQAKANNPQAIEKHGCCKVTRVEHPYIEHEQFPEDSPDMSGVTKLLHKSFTDSIIRLMSQVENKSTLEALIGILQNLTSDNYKSSCFLRAFIRSRNGIPRLIELVDHSYEDICNSSIVALRNLSDDIKNKEVIGQYGAGAICGKLPSNPQVAFSTKTCVSTLYLIRILIYLNKKNCDLIIDNDGMQKIILINKEPSYPMKLRKAAGQVLTVAWELTKMHSKYKKCGWSSKNFDPSVPSGNATLKKTKKGSEGLSPEEQHLISDTNV